MFDPSFLTKNKLWNRRKFLELGLVGIGLTGGGIACQNLAQKPLTAAKIPPIATDLPTVAAINPMQMLRDFDYGKVKQEKGRTIREFRMTAQTDIMQLNNAVNFNTWNLNHRIPGPTLRATEGDRIRIIFFNQAGHSHSLHFHGVHPAEMDGIKPIRHGASFIYEFDATPYGLHLYHCHIAPVTRHIAKGFYGMFIIDPPTPRPPADEIVLVMGGYDLNDDQKNELYAFNGLPDYYQKYPIKIYQNQLVRLYVLNMIEYEAAVTFHIHANMFQIYRSGMTLKSTESSDVITMGVAERHILEFAYRYPGKYMFHPHQDVIAEAGCMGMFEVIS